MKIYYRKALYPADRWFNYIIPKRITLKSNPPIYKWLWFAFELNKEEYQKLLYHKGQRTFVYCPKCNTELISSNSFLRDTDYVYYKCKHCGEESKWDFDTPVPLLITQEKQKVNSIEQ